MFSQPSLPFMVNAFSAFKVCALSMAGLSEQESLGFVYQFCLPHLGLIGKWQ